jgi:hypothetical protein
MAETEKQKKNLHKNQCLEAIKAKTRRDKLSDFNMINN